MSKKISLISICLFLVFGNTNVYAQTTSPSTCVTKDVVIAFFNGVGNANEDATESLKKLKEFYGETTQAGESISYELIYNDTINFYHDIMEVFEQRAAEMEQDARAVYQERYELFFDILHNGSWYDIISQTDDAFKDMASSWLEDVSLKTGQHLVSMLHSSPTEVNYIEHKTRIENWLLEGKKLLFVAHSQGNLFANAAYNLVQSKISTSISVDSVKVVHIAPASTKTNGEHVLADKDLVIKLLRASAGALPSVTHDIPGYLLRPAGVNGETDIMGHGFVEIYINPGIVTSSAIKSHMDNAINSLVAPSRQAQSGFFTVTLTWDGSGDVDLHTYEPDGTWVYYSHKTGHAGYLDVDNTRADGPEHYYAPCDASRLQEGIYTVKIANYARAENRTATVQLATFASGVLGTYSTMLGKSTGSDPSNNHMFNVLVTKNQNTGIFKAVLAQ